MNTQVGDNQVTDNERKWYLTGAIIFALVFMCTILFGYLITPLKLLQLRLSIVGMGLLYNLVIYIYYERTPKQKQEKIPEKKHEIIILFNGKEVEENKL